MMTQARRALLLAIADYDSASSLDYVRKDVPRMRRALERVGLSSANISTNIEDNTQSVLSLGRLRKAIRTFLESATADQDLIIYFSGHGAVIERRRVLIPQDFDPEDARPDELIDDMELLGLARKSNAASVLFLIDACRDSFSLSLKRDGTKGLVEPVSGDDGACDDTPTVAFVYSCALGQTSGKDAVGNECSAFTRAFAEALEAEGEQVRLAEVVADAQGLLNHYVAANVGQQTITVGDQRAHGRRGAPESLVIKESVLARLRDRMDNSRWVRCLKELPSWQGLFGEIPALAIQVAAIVLNAEDGVGEAIKALPQQRWRDANAPFRLLTRLEKHVLPGLKPTAAERAVLLTVPFVYEIVLATAERRLVAEGAGIDPHLPEERPGDSAFRRAWRTFGTNDEVFARIASRLRERGEPRAGQAAEDVAAWRFNAFCHGAGELWNAGPDGWATTAVEAAVRPTLLLDGGVALQVSAVLEAYRLIRFARLMFASYEDIGLDATGQSGSALERSKTFRIGEAWPCLDEVAAVHALNLGARLALDARRLPPLLAEHLGCDDILVLEAVLSLLDESEWRQAGPALSLFLTCPHQALDAALREAVDDLDAHRRRLVQAGENRVIDALPGAYTAGDLKPALTAGKAVYDTDHLRFSLDQGKVMGLLMGEELYGNPDLALRELYQNALDACRYRRAQERYWARTNPGAAPAYVGRITFRFGTEGDRRFIECIDNGVGMADRHLRRLFACAGKRFTESHEYHLDKARWEEAGIPFYPNSRFGIGVLSYFMLSEELEVASQRTAAPGHAPSPRVHARVLGSGSLFRLDREDTTRFDGGGTRVRLYLQDRTRPLAKYMDSILNWLWLPEFDTILAVEGMDSVDLKAGEPAPRFAARGQIIPMQGSGDSTGVARAFWCLPNDQRDGYRSNILPDGAVLVDGILSSPSSERMGDPFHQNQFMPVVVVNMTEDRYISLTADRNKIRSYEPAIAFARACIDDGGWANLAEWRYPTFEICHEMFGRFTGALAKLNGLLLEKDGLPINGVVKGLWAKCCPGKEIASSCSIGVKDVDYFVGVANFGESIEAERINYGVEFYRFSPVLGRVVIFRISEVFHSRANMFGFARNCSRPWRSAGVMRRRAAAGLAG